MVSSRIHIRLRDLVDDRGFTVMEAVVAASIVFVVAMGVISALTFATLSSSQSAARGRATNLANQEIEAARNVPYDNLGTVTASGIMGDPPGSLPTSKTVGEFTVQTAISWQRDAVTHRAKYKNMAVTVAWRRPLPGSVTLSTSIFGRSAIVNAGDVEITVREYDAPNRPVMGAQVYLTPLLSAVRLVSADASGVAFFGMVPTGNALTTVNADGYLIDPTVVPNITVAADTLSSAVVYAQLPSAVRVTVVRSSGAVVSGAAVGLVGLSGSPTATTDAQGVATFSNLLLGNYVASVGPLSQPVAVDAPSGRTHDVSIVVMDPSTIRVTVLGAGGLLLSGATVAISGSSTNLSSLTDGSGVAAFSVTTTGTFTYTASKSGYVTGNGSIDVSTPGGAYSQTITLAGAATIVVEARDGAGVLLPGVSVALTGASSRTGSTGSDGRATFTMLALSAYSITGSKVNYTDGTATKTVVAGDNVVVPITLTAAGHGHIHVHTLDDYDHLDQRFFKIMDPWGGTKSYESDYAGQYTIDNVTPGVGYQGWETNDNGQQRGPAVTFTVTAGATVNVVLHRY